MNTIFAAMMCLAVTGHCEPIFGSMTFRTAAECQSFFQSHGGNVMKDNDAQQFGCYALSRPAWQRVE